MYQGSVLDIMLCYVLIDSSTTGPQYVCDHLCSGLAATYLEVCTDEQLVLDDAMADTACAAAALRCVLAFLPGAKVRLLSQ